MKPIQSLLAFSSLLLSVFVFAPTFAEALPRSFKVELRDFATGKSFEGAGPIKDFAVVEIPSTSEPVIFSKTRSVRIFAGTLQAKRVVPVKFKYSSKLQGYVGQFAVPDGQYVAQSTLSSKTYARFRLRRRTQATPTPTSTPIVDKFIPTIAPTATPTSSGSGGGDQTNASVPPIPNLALWKSNMLTYGKKYCDQNTILSNSTWEGSVWYYDGIRVYQQIGDFTKDPFWYNCANYVRAVYRPYVLGSSGKVGGWRVFAEGLKEDYMRNGDTSSRDAAKAPATNSPFAAAGGGADFELSRETAYLIHAYISALEMGQTAPMLSTAVNNALGHIDQWRNGKAGYIKPFMVGLTFEALIRYHNRTGDGRILPAIQNLADWMFTNIFDKNKGAFPYIYCRSAGVSSECTSTDNESGADLSLLVAPAYAWLYAKTGDPKFQQQGDAIFSGGVQKAWLGGGKPFSQNYRWSIDFVKWRGGK